MEIAGILTRTKQYWKGWLPRDAARHSRCACRDANLRILSPHFQEPSMRHIRFARNLLVLGGAVSACAAILGVFPLASAARDGDPVEELALILKTSVRDPKSRESAIKKQVDALRKVGTVGDMRRAVELKVHSWKATTLEPGA